MKNFTTPEQSKALLQTGIISQPASMHYERFAENDYEWQMYLGNDSSETPEFMEYLPCWAIGDLMDVLPATLTSADSLYDEYDLHIHKNEDEDGNLMYNIAYVNDKTHSCIPVPQVVGYRDLIDAIVDMILIISKQGLGENINSKVKSK